MAGLAAEGFDGFDTVRATADGLEGFDIVRADAGWDGFDTVRATAPLLFWAGGADGRGGLCKGGGGAAT